MKWLFYALITSVVLFVLLGVRSYKMNNRKYTEWHRCKKQWFALIGLAFVAFGCIATVPTGHTGILTTFGKVEDKTLEAGLHIKSPFQEVVSMDNRTQVAHVDLACFSSDIQEVIISYSMNYQIEKSNAQTIYKTIGTDYFHTIMEPRIQEVVKSVISKYDAEKLIELRDTLSKEITETLVSELGNYSIEVVSTSVENIDFSDSFTNSVEAKVVAQQALLKAKTEQEQMTMEKKQEAERQKIEAEAAANVAVIQAEADRDVLKIQSDAAEYAGQKDAAINDALAKSLTDILVEYYKIKQWDGKLPAYYVSGTEGVLPILGSVETAGETEAPAAAD